MNSVRANGERVRLARWRWRPRHRELLQMRASSRCLDAWHFGEAPKCAGEAPALPELAAQRAWLQTVCVSEFQFGGDSSMLFV
jgi:hypothetical protein